MKKILDVSNNKVLNGDNIQHFSSEICNLYRPCGNDECKQDGYNIVFSGDSNINKTKFFPILIKEWFYLVEKGGYLVVKYTPNDILSPLLLEDELWLQWKGKYDILAHKVNDFNGINADDLKSYIDNVESDYLSEQDLGFDNFNDKNLIKKEWVLVLKKSQSTIIEGDSIDKWTFGIITNGKRNDWIEELINSINDLSIPNFEIIICGLYDVKRLEKNFIYIPFNKRNDLGWITKKKNLIIQNAKYENICILHDRYFFDKNWYEGMKKWGNNFEHITPEQMFTNKGAQINIPCISSLEIENPSIINIGYLREQKLFFVNLLDNRDFSKNLYIGGGIHIFKKSFGLTILYNENIFWREGEDVILSQNFNRFGLY